MFDQIPVQLYISNSRIFNNRAVLYILGDGWIGGSIGLSEFPIRNYVLF